MNNNDALNRIRQKKRPAVPPREDATESLTYQETNTTNNQGTNTSINKDYEITSNQDTKMSRYQDLKTKASTLRLEETIATDLTLLCKREGVSREVLVEAMFIYCQNHPSVLEVALEEAHRRNHQRQEISNRKRAQTMMKRFGEEV